MGVKESLGKFGGRFAFEFFLETIHKDIILGLKKYLISIRAEDIPAMVRENQFPPAGSLDFSFAGDNIEYIEKITLIRLVEFIAEARPDLVEEIQGMGEAGAAYLVNLRVHILDRVRQPAGGQDFKAQEDTVLAHCDKCDNKWPVNKEEAGAISVCPFCGAGGDEEEKPTPAPEEKKEEVQEEEEE